MTPVELYFEAYPEVEAAVNWYEDQRTGLGAEFFAAVHTSLQEISTAPRAWPLWPEPRARALGVRRFLMDRFPYALPYLAMEDRLVVLAVAHVRRRPGYWLKRARRLQQVPRSS